MKRKIGRTPCYTKLTKKSRTRGKGFGNFYPINRLVIDFIRVRVVKVWVFFLKFLGLIWCLGYVDDNILVGIVKPLVCTLSIGVDPSS